MDQLEQRVSQACSVGACPLVDRLAGVGSNRIPFRIPVRRDSDERAKRYSRRVETERTGDQRRGVWVALVCGVAAVALAVPLSWDFLQPPSDPSSLTVDRLFIEIDGTLASGELSPRVELLHEIEAFYERVQVNIDASVGDEIWVEVTRDPGSLTLATPWTCGAGDLNKYRSPPGDPHELERALHLDLPATDDPGYDGWTVLVCERRGPIFQTESQGLRYLGPAVVYLERVVDGESDLTSHYERRLPPTWEVIGSAQKTSSFMSGTLTHENGQASWSEPMSGPAMVGETMEGVYVVRDRSAANTAERGAWVGALFAGAGAGAVLTGLGGLILLRQLPRRHDALPSDPKPSTEDDS